MGLVPRVLGIGPAAHRVVQVSQRMRQAREARGQQPRRRAFRRAFLVDREASYPRLPKPCLALAALCLGGCICWMGWEGVRPWEGSVGAESRRPGYVRESQSPEQCS